MQSEFLLCAMLLSKGNKSIIISYTSYFYLYKSKALYWFWAQKRYNFRIMNILSAYSFWCKKNQHKTCWICLY